MLVFRCDFPNTVENELWRFQGLNCLFYQTISVQPGRAGLGPSAAHAAIPVEADVDKGRLLLGGRLREIVGCFLFG